MIFEKVDIMKTIYYDGQMTISLTKDSQSQDITSSKEAHSDYKAALDNLKPIFLHHMELDKYEALESRVSIIGVEEKEVKNGNNGYRIHAVIFFPATNGRSRITTPTLFIPDDDFFDRENQFGEPIHDPDDYLSQLQDWEIEAIDAVLAEAYQYAIKNKVAKPQQPDLFEAAEKIVEKVEELGGEVIIPGEEAATAEEFDGNAEDIEEEDFDDMDDGFSDF